MGLDACDAERCVRFSFSHTTSVDDAERGAEIVGKVLTQMRALLRK
jgi:cysteine sulfinate desulfinase/cysteine desulfurase-like protein